MIDTYSKFDNMLKNRMFYALIYINNCIIACYRPCRDTPFQGFNNSLSFPIYVDLVKLSHIISNLKMFEVWLFPHYFSLILHEFPPFSHFLSSTHQSRTVPSPSLFYFLSTTHIYHYSMLPSHFPPLPSFHHSFSFHSLFYLKAKSNQEGVFKFCSNKITSVKNLHQGFLIPLILCDRSSFPKNLFLLGFV